MSRFVVVGAGITGLAAAFEWRRRRPDDEIVVLAAGISDPAGRDVVTTVDSRIAAPA